MAGELEVHTVTKREFNSLQSKRISIEEMEQIILSKSWFKDYETFILRRKIPTVREPWQEDVNTAIKAKHDVYTLNRIKRILAEVSQKLDKVTFLPIPLLEEFPILQYVTWNSDSELDAIAHISAFIKSNRKTIK